MSIATNVKALIDALRGTSNKPLPPAQQPTIAKSGASAALDPAQAAADREKRSGL